MDSTQGNYKISLDMGQVNLYGTIMMYMKENGRTIRDMVQVFLSHKKMKFMKDSGSTMKKMKKTIDNFNQLVEGDLQNIGILILYFKF